MFLDEFLLFLFEFNLDFSFLLLGLDNSLELISFEFGLLLEPLFLLVLLLPSGIQEFIINFFSMLSFIFFLESSISFILFLGSLGSKSIQFRLSIIGFLLHFSKSGKLLFFFILNSLLLSLIFSFFLSLLEVILNDFLLFLFLLKSIQLFNHNSLFVSIKNFVLENFLFVFFVQIFFLLLILQLSDSLDHILSLSFLFLLILETNELSLLDLLDDLEMSLVLLLLLFLFLLFVKLDQLKSLDFHHQVFSFFFHFSLLNNFFLFLHLHISNGNAFGVVYHLIHFLNIIQLFIEKLLSSRLERVLLSLFLLLEIRQWNLLFLFLLHLEHFFLFGLSSSLLLFLLFFQNFLLMQLLLLASDNSVIFHSLNLGFR